MELSDLIIIGGAAWLIKEGLKKGNAEQAEREKQEEEYKKVVQDMEKRQAEYRRRSAVNARRKETPCFFNDGLSQAEFEKIARIHAKRFRRINNIVVRGAVIYGNVESQTGLSNWDFNIDFNNWGHVTGTYWLQTDNDDSSIPSHYGQVVSGAINEYFYARNISTEDFSSAVDADTNLETPNGLIFNYKKKRFGGLFGKKPNVISMKCDSAKLLHEHLYPVISKIRSNGFKNVKVIAVKDVNDKNSHFMYEVEQVIISGTGYFEAGNTFPDNSEVIITYHDKQDIVMPFSEKKLKGMNYVTAGDKLVEAGFVNIYERKIKDLVTGWLIKDGSVERVLIDGKEEEPIKKGTVYTYDTAIVLSYHTFKDKRKGK